MELKTDWMAGNFFGRQNSGVSVVINGVFGYLLPGEIEYLFKIAAKLPKHAKIIEIGSFMGLSSLLIASGLYCSGNITSKLYCVDTWEGSEEHQGLNIVKSGGLYDIFLKNINESGLATLIRPLRMTSSEASRLFEDEYFDFVFIDGDHSFEGCYEDLTAWYPKVKRDGILLGHDCYCDIFGVKKALEKFILENGFNYTILGVPPLSQYMYRVNFDKSWP